MRTLAFCAVLLVLSTTLSAVSRPHIITFGKWTTVRAFAGYDEDKPIDLKVRPLYVDGKLREYTFGLSHDVTERLFVVRHALRVNDALPDEPVAHWGWQRAGWLVVDRGSGHVTVANFPEYDVETSVSSWYRDYVAFYGVSDEGNKRWAVVRQLGRRKPVLKKSLGEANPGDPQSVVPVWQRQPVRVTFTWKGEKFTYAVRGHTIDIDTGDEDDGTE